MPAQAEKRPRPIQQQARVTSSSFPAPTHARPSDFAKECSTPLSFQSILFRDLDANISVDALTTPDIFSDLLLDQVVASITVARDEYNLKPFFYAPLGTVDAVNYRYDVFRDLENVALVDSINTFAQAMRTMRDFLRERDKLYYERQKQGLFLDAVSVYCQAVKELDHALMHSGVTSPAFCGLRGFLAAYLQSDIFITLANDTEDLRADLQKIAYSLHIQGARVTVAKHPSVLDYGADILKTFEKFSQRAPKEYNFKFRLQLEMNHVEAAILDLVTRLYPETFSFLAEYTQRYQSYMNPTIARFDREIQFYLACKEHIQKLSRPGLAFCYPIVSDQSKAVAASGVFDLSLADKLVLEGALPVTNDFYLAGEERIFVVSGPNQGGKTTFARSFGQLHYLASIGCLVPGTSARLFLYDRLFTHFEKEEDIRNLSGKLEDELIRIHRILESATSNSILIMNESFLSTTLHDALFLSREIMQRIVALDMLCVSVTFLDELAAFSETTVSVVSIVNPRNPMERTFKVVRRTADGLAYAVAIAQKYRLTHDLVKKRISRNTGESTPA